MFCYLAGVIGGNERWKTQICLARQFTAILLIILLVVETAVIISKRRDGSEKTILAGIRTHCALAAGVITRISQITPMIAGTAEAVEPRRVIRGSARVAFPAHFMVSLRWWKEIGMSETSRLRQYLFKASFSAEADRLSALRLLDKIENQKVDRKEIEQVAGDECQQDFDKLEYRDVYRDGFIAGAEWMSYKLAKAN